MKKKIVKLTLLGLGIIILGTTLFIACNKDDDLNDNNLKSKSQVVVDQKTIAKYDKSTNTIELLFSKEKFLSEFETKLQSTSKNLYANDVFIYDSNPTGNDTTASLCFQVFNKATGATTSMFIEVNKTIDNGNIVYKCAGRTTVQTLVCEARNCNDGCKPNSDKTDCTKCPNGGDCKRILTITTTDTGSSITWKDVVGWGLAIIGMFV